MLRNNTSRPFLWADKTMSSLKENKLQACEKYLAGLPSFSVFDSKCTINNVETFYSFSFFSEENHPAVLHTPDSLREHILQLFSDEINFLSDIEHELLVKIIISGGQWPLRDWNDLEPSVGLVRRLWCYTTGQDENRVIHLPHQLCTAALLLLADERHREFRKTLNQIQEAIDNTLYLNGMMDVIAPMNHLASLPEGKSISEKSFLISRMLKAGYDYITDSKGNMILIHSGLADPDLNAHPASQYLSEDVLNAALNSTDNLEDPLYNRLLSLIDGSLRPDLLPEDIADDMILLAKQNVSPSDMRSALSASLICLPTREMTDALNDMYQFVPRWLSLKMSKVQ